MWTVPFLLLTALALQDETSGDRTPVLAVESGRFTPLEVSGEVAVGIDLASLSQSRDGHVLVDAYTLSKEPHIEQVTGVAYSRTLPSYMTRATVSVDCSMRFVRVTQWSYLTDLGYLLWEHPSTMEPLTPQPLSAWGMVLDVACSSVEQARLPVLESFVLFHERMTLMRVNKELRTLTDSRGP